MKTTESSLTITQEIPQQKIEIIPAVEMVPGFLYETAKVEKNKYKCKVYRKHDLVEEGVTISFWEGQYNRSWMEAFIPLDYPMKKMGIDIHKIESRDSGDGQRKRGSKTEGRISNMGMMECWGLYFRKYVNVPGGRALIIQSMVAEFPDVTERILKWVDSYKSYYNMGKLPGCVKQVNKAKWIERTYPTTVVGSTMREVHIDPLAALEDEDD